MKKRIAILGSTGSIGTQTLEVIAQNPDSFEVEVLTANNNIELLIGAGQVISPECHCNYQFMSLRSVERGAKG